MSPSPRPAALQFTRRLALAAVVAGAGATSAPAQMVLPGAVNPTPAGAAQAPVGRPPRPKAAGAPAAPAPAVVPMPASLGGRSLLLNGSGSQVSFAAADRTVSVSRLVLAGEMISKPRTACQVQADGTPLAVTSLGRPTGVERIRVDYPACPIVFDVLDGAVLVDATQGACTFAERDCRVETAGLWGPLVSDLGPDKDKGTEKARARAEAAVRANYKALTAATKDRPTVMGYAREQAQFSSTREEICRNYAEEGRHGFCASKLTEARAVQLRDKLAEALDAKAARLAKKRGGRAGKEP